MRNYTSGSGGGIYIYAGTTLYLKDINISRNDAVASGGGIYNLCDWSSVTNSGWTGYHHFEQLLITHNRAFTQSGGGICTGQAFSCINSTISENKCNNYGAGLACGAYENDNNEEQDVNPSFFNTIFWHDFRFSGPLSEVFLAGDLSDPQFCFCTIENWANPAHGFDISPPYTWDDQGWTYPLNSNTGDDPNFIDPNNDDFNIHMNNSSCYNQGSNGLYYPQGFSDFDTYFGYMWSNDFAGNSRQFNGTIDRGAFETSTQKNLQDSPTPYQKEAEIKFSIYPNPCIRNQSLIIKSNRTDIILSNIEIFTYLGQHVYWSTLENELSEEFKLDFSSAVFDHGMYIVKIQYLDKTGRIGAFYDKLSVIK